MPEPTSAACPSGCDPDCEVDCHEHHAVPWKRHHDPAACPGGRTLPAPGSPVPDPLICQWCGHPVPPDQATWWDDRPQCPDPIRCDKNTRPKEQPDA